jgi:predicted NUDIX family NTP pyrophosphohydrolase
MSQITAGMLMCRNVSRELEFFLVHPGGPFFVRKNEGAWSIPKGIPNEAEDLLLAAQREFFEETGITPTPPFHSLKSTKLKSGKIMHVWLFDGEWDPASGIVSNTFSLEWPPRSGKYKDVPEVDRAEWMSYEKAKVMINPHQAIFLDRAREFYSNR